MPPVRTARNTNSVKAKSHYETPVLKIIVGEAESPFHVNEGLLQSTSFFAQHGPPRERARKPANNERRPSSCQSSDGMFVSDGSERTVEPDNDIATVDLTNDDADYILRGRHCYTRDAFAIFVRSLNDAPLQKPRDQDDCRALFEAYALGQQYDTEILQNQVIDTLQSFYVGNTIPFSDIIYLVNYWGDEVECFLAAYLIAQAAYEMAIDYPRYRAENREIQELFSGRMRFVAEQLFSAVAQSKTAKDPAKDKRAWRFGKV